MLKNKLMCILLFLPVYVSGQNLWPHPGRIIDFNYDPPKTTYLEGTLGNASYPSLSDADGNLLITTNGWTVYTNNFKKIADIKYDLYIFNLMIIPMPGSDDIFYILGHHGGYDLYYCKVQVDPQTYEGGILEEGLLAKNVEYRYTVVSGCDHELMWVITKNWGEVNFLHSYRIDSNGIDPEPVVNKLDPSYQLKYLPANMKASPDSKKVAFGAVIIDKHYLFILDYDFTQGKINKTTKLEMEVEINNIEFSPNSQILYVAKRHAGEIEQINLAEPGKRKLVFSSKPLFVDIQIATNGKIYIDGDDEDLYVIHKPNVFGRGCNIALETNLINVNHLPFMLSSYANPTGFPDIALDPYDTVQLCEGAAVKLADHTDTTLSYHWTPSVHLDSDTLPNPEFYYPQKPDKRKEFIYTVTGKKGYCEKTDTTVVEVYTNPQTALSGPASVCPFVENVDYFAVDEAGYTYEWLVKGGKIKQNEGSQIKVDWGESNEQASVKILAKNEIGCASDTTILPVTVNVQLKPATPHGLTAVCQNLKDQVMYQVPRTTGSVYTWQLIQGEILEGQGSHQVKVVWEAGTPHQIWIAEQSTTVDTVCYGVSDTLDVTVFEDTTVIDIQYVTIDPVSDSLAQIHWTSNAPDRLARSHDVERVEFDGTTWQLMAQLPADRFQWQDSLVFADINGYEYIIRNVNGCEQPIESPVHNTMLLEGTANQKEESLFIHWLPYYGWQDQLSHYEIWRKIDDEAEFQFVALLEPDQRSYQFGNGRDGFNHSFKVKAVHKDQPYASWSNQLAIQFEHKLTIPNVFTPNNDQYNQTFFIDKLELYPDNHMTIVDRNGNKVFDKVGYQGDWNGFNVSSGTYYYHLYIPRYDRDYKGWVQIIK
ncbi:MAG: gliding motility-associated C-terminal domain-containing protein [Candidatus Cyclobacteriaceae bacterium M3_2C_046]